MEKLVRRITDWYHEACRVKTIGDPEGQIFLSHPHTNRFLCFKRLPEVPQYAEMRHDMIVMTHFNITMMSLDDHAREFQYNQ